MNDPSLKPVSPPAPQKVGNANDTVHHDLEVTGSQPVTASSSGAHATVARSTASGTTELQFVGDYVIIKKIGEGGMGAVYLAEDTKLGRKAAIKTMKPQLAANQPDRDRFLREARAAAAVEHDNIVPIWGVGEAADGTPFLAMQFLQGEMLDSRLKREPVANLGLMLKVAREVADGLAAAHAKGLIHRDIKPGNVWLEGDLSSKQLAEQIRRCKILDFGLARSVDKEDAQITASGAILGTPAFMAPEQARGEKVDHRADLFSLGVMLYRMATGKLPFKGQNAMAVLIALTTETPAPVRQLAPNLPPKLTDLIDRLMCKDPAGRPQSAAEVSATVREIVKDWQAKKAGSPTPGGTTSAAPASQPAVPVYVLPAPAPNPWEDVTEEEPEAPITRTAAPAKRSRAPWFIAGGVLGLLGLIALLAVVIIRVQTAEGTLIVEVSDPDVEAKVKNGKLVLIGADGKERYTLSLVADRNTTIDAGQYTIRVEGADGLVLDTREFTLKKNGQVTVRVTLDPKVAKKPDPKKESPDRKAAEYVLSVGGKVRVNDEVGAIALPADLPKGAFRLTGVDFAQSKQVSNAGLAAFRDCTSIKRLDLFNTVTTNEGLANFKNCKGLTVLIVTNTQVTDEGLAAFGACEDLVELHVYGTKVTDEGLAHFKGCKKITTIHVGATPITAAGLAAFKDCERLTYANLAGAKVGDAALAQLTPHKQLTEVHLHGTGITQKGLIEFMNAMPQCEINWDGGSIKPKVNFEADRKAAEYVLSLGGVINVNDRSLGEITDKGKLPKDPFRLATISLRSNQRVTDAGLAVLKGCNHITWLEVDNTPIGDAGLAHLKGCTSLRDVNLTGTKITDAGLAALADCKDLNQLHLQSTQATDAGVGHLKGCTKLTNVNLDYSQVGDAWLAHLKDCKDVVRIQISGTKVTDAGLAHLKACKSLTHLGLLRTAVTDKGLAHLPGIENLAAVNLMETQVSDEGLAHLKKCGNLTLLHLQKTKVTANGVKDLAKALPQCKIEWNGNTIEPTAKADPDRAAAEYVLSVGGTVAVSHQDPGRPLAAVADLPKGPFVLTAVNLDNTARATDGGLAVFEGCRNLTWLNLNGANVTDAGMAHFRNCNRLTQIDLMGTPVSDAGMAHLAGCEGLQSLRLNGTKVGDAGLAHLKGCKRLDQLHLGGTPVTDAGLAHLAGCKDLIGLSLSGVERVTDDGLAHFAGCKNLTSLWLDGTKVTDAGLAHFKDCAKLTHIWLSGAAVGDAGLAHLRGCKALTDLHLASTKVGDATLEWCAGLEKLAILSVGKTKVTEAGVKKLADARSGCRIGWDGGIIEPKKK